MRTSLGTVGCILLLAITASPDARAQQPTPAAESAAKSSQTGESPIPPVPLQLHIVIAKLKGDKRIGSTPYTLTLTPGSRASLRMYTQIPVPLPAGVFKDGKSVEYHNVGTGIDGNVTNIGSGRYRVTINISEAAIYPSDEITSGVQAPKTVAIRSFDASNTSILRDGQSTQFMVATDKMNGEVIRADVTLTVLK